MTTTAKELTLEKAVDEGKEDEGKKSRSNHRVGSGSSSKCSQEQKQQLNDAAVDDGYKGAAVTSKNTSSSKNAPANSDQVAAASVSDDKVVAEKSEQASAASVSDQ